MYKVKYHKQVIKFLQKQDKKTVKIVIDFFDEIKKDLNFKNHDVKPLLNPLKKYHFEKTSAA